MPDRKEKGLVEMSGDLRDESHVNFHVTANAKIINAFNKARTGADLLGTLVKLKFRSEKRWIKNRAEDPNAQVLLEVLAWYKENDKRFSRNKLFSSLFEYAIGKYINDLATRERMDGIIFQFFVRANRWVFDYRNVDPANWYPVGRGSPTSAGYETEDVSIEEEYKKWYGVDPTEDIVELPIEVVDRLIRESRERVGLPPVPPRTK